MSTSVYQSRSEAHVCFALLLCTKAARKKILGTPAAAQAAQELAAAGADMVLVCVGNDDDLRSVCLGDDGAFQSMKAGSVFVDNTTASADIARQLDKEARKSGFGF